ncbi:MAG: Jag N-terminal domain-containing protein [Firmicutes bacterium]|nr:Jag N-terminal domain-containing protein [Bacillota bacterium]
MIKNYEAAGKTVDEAIDKACAFAGVDIDEAEIEVLDLGSRGFFGIGQKDARVRISVEVPDPKPTPAAKTPVYDKKAEAKPEVKAEAKAEAQPEAAETKAEGEEKPRRKRTHRGGRGRGKNRAAAAEGAAEAKPERSERPERKERGERAERPRRERRPRQNAEMMLPPELDAQTEAAVVSAAMSFLRPIFRALQLQPEGNSKVSGSTVWIIFSGSNLGQLIGRRGEMLNALQYLTNLAVNRDRDPHIRIVLDVEGYRAEREDTLAALARRMADKAVKSGKRVELEPMSPTERRIVHLALQNDRRVETTSYGEEPYRRVVITCKKKAAAPAAVNVGEGRPDAFDMLSEAPAEAE